jgi:MFS family permease
VNVLILALCQAMLLSGTSLVVSSSALVGVAIAPNPALATLPLSLQFLTTMFVVAPASLLMKRFGRRPVFVLGAVIGAGGFAVAASAVHLGNFALFTAAGILVGVHNAVGQFYRFAAAESVEARWRSRAISLTLAGGVLASLIGPNIARFTKDLVQPAFTASFAALLVTTLVAAGLSSLLRLKTSAETSSSGTTRPLRQIARQPSFIVALAAATIAYATMNMVMTGAPLAMHAMMYPFPATTLVIQWHVFAMFFPSFFTGDLVRRFGVLATIAAGCLLELAAIGTNLAGQTMTHFLVALICLGLGWNFMFVGATTLLGDVHSPAERARVQGLNDTFVFTAVTFSSLAAGALVTHFGWVPTNLLALPGVTCVLVLVVWYGLTRSRVAAELVVTSPQRTPIG